MCIRDSREKHHKVPAHALPDAEQHGDREPAPAGIQPRDIVLRKVQHVAEEIVEHALGVEYVPEYERNNDPPVSYTHLDVYKRQRHIRRLQQGGCSIELGFILSDLLTGLERTSDHCSNIAGCVIDTAQHNLNLHESLRATRLESADFIREFNRYARKYALPASAAATD